MNRESSGADGGEIRAPRKQVTPCVQRYFNARHFAPFQRDLMPFQRDLPPFPPSLQVVMVEGAGGGRPEGGAVPPPPPRVVARQKWKQVKTQMAPQVSQHTQQQYAGVEYDDSWSPYKG
jgi:hypothetical protein